MQQAYRASLLYQVLEPMEAPPELLMEMLPFQKEFLGWAVTQEQGSIKGGILADEMGMGKTIQVHFSARSIGLSALATGIEASSVLEITTLLITSHLSSTIRKEGLEFLRVFTVFLPKDVALSWQN